MTVMTNNLNATNITGNHMKKPSVGKSGYVLTTDGGDETFDIDMAMANKRKSRKQALGTSVNIFDTSSIGSVPMRNFLHSKDQVKTSIAMKGVPTNEVSMVEMRDSMAFDDPKAMLNGLGAKPINGTIEAVSPPQELNAVGGRDEDEAEYDRTSSGHYMKVESESFGRKNTRNDGAVGHSSAAYML